MPTGHSSVRTGDPDDDFNAFDLFQPFDFFSQARLIAFIGKDPRQGRIAATGDFAVDPSSACPKGKKQS